MRILIASPVDQDAISRLQKDHDVICELEARDEALRSLVKDREVIVFRSGLNISRSIMESAPSLKLLVRAGSGLDNVDLGYLNERRIRLSRIPEPAAQAVAELTFALMLALARKIREADRSLQQGHWAKHEFIGNLLRGKILGVIGAGNIGTRVGQLGAALDMESIGCVEYPSPERAAQFRKKSIVLTNFDEVISRADFVSIHVPLKESTYNLVDARVLARMKPGSFLLSMARGRVLDEQALYKELVDGCRLRGAALDVHNEEAEGKISPLAGLPNVFLTPHIGSMTIDTQREIGRRVVEVINSFATDYATAQPGDVPVERIVNRFNWQGAPGSSGC
jgi:phosphoglycerate dehydrogenase-like enzyme